MRLIKAVCRFKEESRAFAGAVPDAHHRHSLSMAYQLALCAPWPTCASFSPFSCTRRSRLACSSSLGGADPFWVASMVRTAVLVLSVTKSIGNARTGLSKGGGSMSRRQVHIASPAGSRSRTKSSAATDSRHQTRHTRPTLTAVSFISLPLTLTLATVTACRKLLYLTSSQ